MKRKLLILFCLMTATVMTAMAQPQFVKIKNNGVNLRKSPSTTAPILMQNTEYMECLATKWSDTKGLSKNFFIPLRIEEALGSDTYFAVCGEQDGWVQLNNTLTGNFWVMKKFTSTPVKPTPINPAALDYNFIKTEIITPDNSRQTVIVENNCLGVDAYRLRMGYLENGVIRFTSYLDCDIEYIVEREADPATFREEMSSNYMSIHFGRKYLYDPEDECEYIFAINKCDPQLIINLFEKYKHRVKKMNTQIYKTGDQYTEI